MLAERGTAPPSAPAPPPNASRLTAQQQAAAQATLLAWVVAKGGGVSRLRPFYEETAGTGLTLSGRSDEGDDGGSGGGGGNSGGDGEARFCARPGEQLLFVPAACFLTPMHGMATPWGQAVLRAGREQELGGGGGSGGPARVFLAMALMHARVGSLGCRGVVGHGTASSAEVWRAYTATMPSSGTGCRCFPEMWSSAELCALGEGDGLRRRAEASQAVATSELALIRTCLAAVDGSGSGSGGDGAEAAAHTATGPSDSGGNSCYSPTRSMEPSTDDAEGWAWARCMVSSRAFTNPLAVGRAPAGSPEAVRCWRDAVRLSAAAAAAAAAAVAAAAAAAAPAAAPAPVAVQVQATPPTPVPCAEQYVRVALAAFDCFLVPFADLANHSFGEAEMAWDYDERRQGFYFEAARALPPCCSKSGGGGVDGYETRGAHISYGRKAVQDLLLHYGFCPSADALACGAMAECVSYELELPVQLAAREGGMVRFVKAGVGPASAAGVDELLVLLRGQAAATAATQVGSGEAVELVAERAALNDMVALLQRRARQVEEAMTVGYGGGDDDTFCAAARAEGSATVRGSVTAVLSVTLQVCAALRAFATAALSLLGQEEKEGEAEGEGGVECVVEQALARLLDMQPGSTLGVHVRRDLKRYARGRLRAWPDATRLAARGAAGTTGEGAADDVSLDEVAAVRQRLKIFVGPHDESKAALACEFDLFGDILSSSDDEDC